MEENTFNFTKDILNKIVPPATKREIYKDNKEKGLILIVSYGGSKVYYLAKRIQGKYYRIKIGNFPELAISEARERAIELKNQIAKGINPMEKQSESLEEITFKQLFDLYVQNYAQYKIKRWEEAVATVNKHAKHLYDKKISEITRDDIQKIFNNLTKEGKKVAANRMICRFSSIFNKAIEWELSEKNPASRITKHKEQSRERCLTEEEQSRFLKALRDETNHKVRDFILICLFTAARKSNVLSMRWEDICFTNKTWKILHTKNGVSQLLPLGDKVIEILMVRKEETNSEWVFPSSTSASGHLEEPIKVWRRILKRAGIKDLRLHDLRRTMGSCMGDSGASEYVIGKALNHKSSKSTAIYVRLRTADSVRKFMNQAIDKLSVG